MTTAAPGDRVVIDWPENERLHGTEATVDLVASWGCYLTAPAAAGGQVRCVWEEMRPVPAAEPAAPARRLRSAVQVARDMGFTGDTCTNAMCGKMTVVQNGTCLKCVSCGETSGCS